SLAWEHPERPLTELIRQSALRRLAGDPHAVRRLPRLLEETGWERLAVEARPRLEVGRGGELLALAEQASVWAKQCARCPPHTALAWFADLRAASDAGAFFATVTEYVWLARR